MSFRTQLLVVLGLATVATAACDEFPEPLESDSGLIPIVIQPVDWPTELVLGGSATLEVAVQDRAGRAVLDVPVSWALLPESAGHLQDAGASDGSQQTLSGTNLGWAHISVSVTGQEPFADQTFVDSIPILLAGVEIDAPAADTTLTAVGDQMVLSAAGVSSGGNAVSVAGLEWQLVSGTAVSALTPVQADQVTIQADAEGTAVVAVTHTRCISGSPCADTVRVTVDQLADSVALNSRADTLVAEDAVQLNAEAFDANGNTAPNETITWQSRNTSVATVDNTGLVTAEGSGETRVVASAPTGVADSATITVNASGAITVDLTDAPADLLASAQLFLGGVFVIDNVVNNGRRYLLDTPFSVDLLTLADTVAALAAGQVPAGTYNNLILDVDSARITLQDSVTFSDLTRTRTLTLSPDTVVAAINGTATVADNDTVRIVLDFDVDGSFPLNEPVGGVVDEPVFTPTTRVVKRTEAASISGSVGTTGAADTTNIAVRAVRTDIPGDTAYARTDAAGDYTVRYLAPGAYDLSISRPPACHVPTPALLSVAVTAGEAALGSDFSIDPVAIDSLATVPAADTIHAIGFTTSLSATAYEGTTPLTGLRVDWSSADPTIATISPGGVVTAVASGVARLVATACGSTDTALVTVQQVPTLITLAPDAPQVDAGGTVQFSATLEDSNGVAIDTASFEYSSSDTTIATIDPATGLATALKSGASVIEVLHPASGLFDSTELSVLLAPTTSFSVNSNNGCALTTTGQVVCWGPNPDGILGFSPIPDDFGNPDWQTAYRPQEIPLPTSETYTQVNVGYAHACALTAAGDIYCWGSGGSGQLGNGSTFDTHNPVLVQRPVGETFNDVAAGDGFTCGNTDSGQAYCWGQNFVGQLGNGTTSDASTPQAVAQVAGLVFYDLTAEERTVCAIGTNNAGYCWGEGHRGDLGNGNTADSFTPVGVSMPVGDATFTQIVASTEGFCALGGSGVPYCWGADAYELNAGNDMTTPQQVGSETFVTLGKSNATLCGATAAGQVRCTGGNYHGQFGNGTTARSGSQWENGATGMSATALDGGGWDTMCGLDAGGKVMCWGWKEYGLTGTGDIFGTPDPLQVSGPPYIAVDGGDDSVCGLTNGNEVLCWGFIYAYTGSATERALTPTQTIPPPAGVALTDVAVGQNHVCVLTDGGEIYCIGENYAGQLGNGTFDWSANAWVLAAHPAGGSWSQLTAGREFNCALDTTSDVYCWGYSGNGQIGAGPGTAGDAYYTSPHLTWEVNQAFTSVDAGSWHACATTTSSAIFCWGWNGRGQLGTADYTDRDTPSQVSTGQFFNRVSAGGRHTCGLTFGDAAYCWGGSNAGQIGDNGLAINPTVPTAVNGGFTFDWIEAGAYNTCGRLLAGGAKCWGGNWNGQLGLGYFEYDPEEPVDAWAALDPTDMFAGGEASCATDATGAIYCAGSHNNGYTGVGLNAYEVVPVEVGGSGSN